MERLFEIVDEDPGLLVVNKPAGLVCHPTKGDAFSSLISRVRIYLGPGSNPQFINRLDRETSGLIFVGKTAPAALELRRTWENGTVEKEYRAIVHGWVAPDHELIDGPLGKDEHSAVAIKDTVRADGAPAQTEFWVERRFQKGADKYSLLRVRPHTGRKHQIRVHLAWRGHAVVGDKLYGADERLYLDFVQSRLREEQWAQLVLPHHALHAQRARLSWQQEPREFLARPESWFVQFIP